MQMIFPINMFNYYIFILISVNIYSCSGMARGDCSLCKNFEESHPFFNCRWCDNSLRCEYRAHCSTASSVTMCPAPQLDEVTLYGKLF